MTNPAMFDDVIPVSVDQRVAQVRLNRPEHRNALTMSLWKALGEKVDALARSDHVSVILIMGTGDSFCAGADISEFENTRGNAEETLEYERIYEGCCDRIAASAKPTIAAIDGFCMGGDCNLAMSCDFRIASPASTFAIPAARLSVIYGVSGTRRLREDLFGATAGPGPFCRYKCNVMLSRRRDAPDDPVLAVTHELDARIRRARADARAPSPRSASRPESRPSVGSSRHSGFAPTSLP